MVFTYNVALMYLDAISNSAVTLSSFSKEVCRYKGSETSDATINEAGKTRIAATPPICNINEYIFMEVTLH